MGLQTRLLGGVVLAGEGVVVELGAVGFDGRADVRPAEVRRGGKAVEQERLLHEGRCAGSVRPQAQSSAT